VFRLSHHRLHRQKGEERSLNLNNKQIVGGIFCDLTKAFDCMDHDILISKTEKYGIIGKGKSFSNHTSKVDTNES
jgi:hypothetical protein